MHVIESIDEITLIDSPCRSFRLGCFYVKGDYLHRITSKTTTQLSEPPLNRLLNWGVGGTVLSGISSIRCLIVLDKSNSHLAVAEIIQLRYAMLAGKDQ